MDRFHYEDGKLKVEAVEVSDLAERYGTPLYVYSQETLLGHYDRLSSAFGALGADIHFSVKACPNLSILRLLRDQGAGFDVVSGGELLRALAAGAAPDGIVFAGVGKSDAEIGLALEHDILQFNVESESELRRIDALARERDKLAHVALRVNPDVDPETHTYITTGKRENKFGVDLEAAGRLIDLMDELEGVRLKGLHMHIGSQILDTRPFVDALTRLVDFADAERADGHDIQVLDIGGGFGIHYKERTALPADEIAEALRPVLEGKPYRIAIEPGRFIAGNSGILLTRVLHVKQSGSKRFVVVDAAMNDLLRPALYGSFHWVWPVEDDRDPRDGQSLEELGIADIVGPICESGDFLAKDRRFPEVERGDLLCVFSAGAYGMSMTSNYNTRPRPAELLVDGSEERIIRRRETIDDLLAPERAYLPDER